MKPKFRADSNFSLCSNGLGDPKCNKNASGMNDVGVRTIRKNATQS